MKRSQLEHILRAAGSVSGCREIVVVGSQAILASFPSAPEELLVSMEADVYPLREPGKADLIDGCIGELSPFHETFGYYAHGVGPETSLVPKGWKDRLVTLESSETGGTVGLCLSPVDLTVSKLLAGRERDLAFVRIMFREGLVTKSAVEITMNELKGEQARLAAERLASCTR